VVKLTLTSAGITPTAVTIPNPVTYVAHQLKRRLRLSSFFVNSDGDSKSLLLASAIGRQTTTVWYTWMHAQHVKATTTPSLGCKAASKGSAISKIVAFSSNRI
jgi:hypothetical protein